MSSLTITSDALSLRGQSLDALLVGADDAEALAAQLRARV